MVGEDARPDDVDLEDVDVGGAGGEELLIEREPLVGDRRGDQLDLIAGLLRPCIGAVLADLVFLAKRAAGDRNLDRLGAGGG